MMKKLLLFAAIAFATLACSEKKSYTVNGTVEREDMNGRTVFLKTLLDSKLTAVDSVVIANGKFEFKGSIETPEIYYIEIANFARLEFILENAKIDVTISKDFHNVSGTELNNVAYDYVKQRMEILKKGDEIFERYENAQADGSLTPEFEDELDAEYDKLQGELNDLGFEFLKTNINNMAGECLLAKITSQMESEKIEELLVLANAETMQRERFKGIAERLQIAKTVAVGQPFVDLEMPNPQGEVIKLSDYAGKGKYVLVDFWASWCGPCRDEMPTLVDVYTKYKDKNFEIVGVSFDNAHEKWIKGIEELNITWVQMSDVKYWQSEGAKLYNVRSIPHTVLIDPQGIIIEKDLRGAKLKEKLEELIK